MLASWVSTVSGSIRHSARKGSGSGFRRVVHPSGDPAEAIRGLEWVRSAEIPGLVPILAVHRHPPSGVVHVQEPLLPAVDLSTALPVAHRYVSTSVALSVVGEAARALAELHALGGLRPPLVHGRIEARNLFLMALEGPPPVGPSARRGPGGRVLVGGVEGRRGSVQEDIRGLLDVLRALLAPKRDAPGGAALLERLARLRIQSAGELADTIDAHLRRQGLERVGVARERFFRKVLSKTMHGGAASARAPELEMAGAPEGPSPEELERALEDAFDGIDALSSDDLRDELASAPPAREDLDDSAPTRVVDPATMRGIGDAAPVVSDVHRRDPRPGRAGSLAPARRPPPPPPPAVGSGIPPPPPPAEPPPSAGPSTAARTRHGLMAPAAAPPPVSKAAGAVLVGDYRVVAAIGKGGMGEIYLARALERDRLVALKVLGAAESGDEEALSMLMDEAAIMARIEHPHVLKVLDFGRAQGRIFLASEYLEGRPLVRVMIASYDRDGGMDHVDVAWVGAQAARGLHAAHTATTKSGTPLRVVHRDVSPQNIFLTYDGLTKVIDFGVARASERFSRTQVGLVKGKAAYMSPEQTEGRPLDARSDVFSLGVCLWEMIAGRRLFKRDLDYDTLLAVQSAPILPPSEVRGRPDPKLDAIVLAALARDVEARLPDAASLAAQLEGYARTRGAPDGRASVEGLMGRLFGAEAEKERALVAELEARAATEEEALSLRELSGVGHQGGGREITVVGEPDALGALDRYGPAQGEVTGQRVLRKVHRLAGRSGEHERRGEGPEEPLETELDHRRAGRPGGRGRPWLLLALLFAVLALALDSAGWLD